MIFTDPETGKLLINTIRWNMTAIVVGGDEKQEKENLAELQRCLDDGYEPFSATPHATQKPAPIISQNPSAGPQIIMGNMIWLKKPERHLRELTDVEKAQYEAEKDSQTLKLPEPKAKKKK